MLITTILTAFFLALKEGIDSDDSDDSDSDDEEMSNNPTRKYQANTDSRSCLMPQHLETDIVVNSSKSVKKVKTSDGQSITIAPGEGKIPSNFLRQEHFDVMSFVRHHPTGRFGLHHPRSTKLTPSVYFNQRLLNQDERFSKDPFYIFMCAFYVERLGLEKQISISGMKGVPTGGAGEKKVTLKDPFDVFKKLKGSPRYWQTAKNELIAKIKQLGAFHVFFTFSCGEMRWSEVYLSILKRKGFQVTIPSDWSGDDKDLLVQGKTLQIFLQEDLQISKHELFKDYTFLITRMFDARVKSFIKNVLMGSGKDKIPYSYYNYRIEFQVTKYY